MRADSSSSSGIVSMYWRSKNTPVGVAAPGMITPHSVLFILSCVITRKTGTRMTEMGIISVAMIRTKIASRPLNWYLLSANAAMLLITRVISVATIVTITLFLRYV